MDKVEVRSSGNGDRPLMLLPPAFPRSMLGVVPAMGDEGAAPWVRCRGKAGMGDPSPPPPAGVPEGLWACCSLLLPRPTPSSSTLVEPTPRPKQADRQPATIKYWARPCYWALPTPAGVGAWREGLCVKWDLRIFETTANILSCHCCCPRNTTRARKRACQGPLPPALTD